MYHRFVILGSAVALAIAAAACGTDSGGSHTSSGSTSNGPGSPSSGAPAVTSATPSRPSYVTAAVRVGASPAELAFGFGSLWVVTHRGAEVDRINPRTNRVIASAASPGGTLIGVAVGAGHVWYLDGDRQQVEGVNARTNKVDVTVPVHSDGGSVDFGAGAVWFAAASGKLIRIDPHKRQVTGTRRLAGADAFLTVHAGGDTVWVVDGDASRLYTIDPRNLAVRHTQRLAGTLLAVTTGFGSLWVGADDGHLYQLDLTTGNVQRTIVLPAIDHIAIGTHRLWVRVSDVQLVSIDPGTGKTVSRYTLKSAEIPGGGIACQPTSIWAVNWDEDNVWRIPTTT